MAHEKLLPSSALLARWPMGKDSIIPFMEGLGLQIVDIGKKRYCRADDVDSIAQKIDEAHVAYKLAARRVKQEQGRRIGGARHVSAKAREDEKILAILERFAVASERLAAATERLADAWEGKKSFNGLTMAPQSGGAR